MRGGKLLARLGGAITSRGLALAWLLYVAGVLGFALLPMIARKTFLDENAFILDGAATGIRQSGSLAAAQHAMRGGLGAAAGPRQLEAALRWHLPAGVELYSQPFGGSSAAGSGGADWVWRQQPGGRALALQVGFAVSHHLRGVRWLAKDFVWVIPDARCGLVHSTQAWVDRYQLQGGATTARNCTAPGPCATEFGRGGAMQQALVLEVPSDEAFSSAEIIVEARDGLLPKVDLFYLVKVHLERHQGIASMLPGQYAPWKQRVLRALPLTGHSARERVAGALGALQAMLRCASGRAGGAHAAFKDFGVDSLTVRPVSQVAAPPQSRRQLLRGDEAAARLASALEASLRCLNNLLERLHHASFLYLLLSPDRFVSIAEYAFLPVLLMSSALAAAALEKRRCSGDGLGSRGATDGGGGGGQEASERVASGGEGAAWVVAAGLVGALYVACGSAGLVMWRVTCPATSSGSILAGDGDVSDGQPLRLPTAAAAAATTAACVLVAAAYHGAGCRAGSGSSWWRGGAGTGSAAVGTPGSAGGSFSGSGTLRDNGSLPPPRQLQGSWWRCWRHAKVAVLSVLLVQAAALMCLNWALAYVSLLALLPPALLARPWRCAGTRALLPLASAALASPPAAALAAGVDLWGGMLCEATGMVRAVVAAVYLPLWCACVGIGVWGSVER